MITVPAEPMPRPEHLIRITGRVFPSCIEFSFTTSLMPAIQLDPMTPSILDGLTARFEFSIQKSQVEVLCHVNRIRTTDFDFLLMSAYETTRSAVDLMAFSIGNGLTLILEKAHYPDGTVADILHSDQTLTPLCTAYQTNQSNPDGSLDTALLTILGDREIMMALHDLTETMEAPHRIRINCFRAVETIMQSIGDDGRPIKIYGLLRDSLNVSQKYIDPIIEESKKPRHGKRLGAGSLSEAEIRQRTWRIMNRFLEFRKRGNVPLSSPEFDLL